MLSDRLTGGRREDRDGGGGREEEGGIITMGDDVRACPGCGSGSRVKGDRVGSGGGVRRRTSTGLVGLELDGWE